MENGLQESFVKSLYSAQRVTRVIAKMDDEENLWKIGIQFKVNGQGETNTLPVGLKRGGIRYFQSLDSVARYLARVGGTKFTVDFNSVDGVLVVGRKKK